MIKTKSPESPNTDTAYTVWHYITVELDLASDVEIARMARGGYKLVTIIFGHDFKYHVYMQKELV